MKRRGFAMMLAIVSVALVAGALAALSLLFAGEMRRTSSLKQDAQIEQLLLAGAADATTRAAHWQDAPPIEGWPVQLPDDLANEGATIIVSSRLEAQAVASISLTATIRGRRGTQELKFQKLNGRWKLMNARLLPFSR